MVFIRISMSLSIWEHMPTHPEQVAVIVSSQLHGFETHCCSKHLFVRGSQSKESQLGKLLYKISPKITT